MLTTFQLITLDYWENVYNMVSFRHESNTSPLSKKAHVKVHKELEKLCRKSGGTQQGGGLRCFEALPLFSHIDLLYLCDLRFEWKINDSNFQINLVLRSKQIFLACPLYWHQLISPSKMTF